MKKTLKFLELLIFGIIAVVLSVVGTIAYAAIALSIILLLASPFILIAILLWIGLK